MNPDTRESMLRLLLVEQRSGETLFDTAQRELIHAALEMASSTKAAAELLGVAPQNLVRRRDRVNKTFTRKLTAETQ